MSNLVREYEVREFYSLSNIPKNWSDDVTNNWVASGTPAKINLMQISVNRRITRRNLYAYLWAEAISAPAFFFCRIAFLDGNEIVHELPVNITYGFDQYSINQIIDASGGIYGKLLGGPIGHSVLCAPLAGGIVAKHVYTLTLRNPFSANGPVPEPNTAIPLQPHPIDIQCDSIRFDVMGWANYKPYNFRAFMASISPEREQVPVPSALPPAPSKPIPTP